jgi:hypothetical protein
VGDDDDGPPPLGIAALTWETRRGLRRAPSRKQPRTTALPIHGGTTMRGDEKCSCSCVYIYC